MATLVKGSQRTADWVSNGPTQSGYTVDFSLESLRGIDRFFDEHSIDGRPVPKGHLTKQLGFRVCAPGSYVGEGIIHHYGEKWHGDDTDPEAEMSAQVVVPSGALPWPVQRVIKRFKSGREDGVYVYGCLVNRGCCRTSGCTGGRDVVGC